MLMERAIATVRTELGIMRNARHGAPCRAQCRSYCVIFANRHLILLILNLVVDQTVVKADSIALPLIVCSNGKRIRAVVLIKG